MYNNDVCFQDDNKDNFMTSYFLNDNRDNRDNFVTSCFLNDNRANFMTICFLFHGEACCLYCLYCRFNYHYAFTVVSIIIIVVNITNFTVNTFFLTIFLLSCLANRS